MGDRRAQRLGQSDPGVSILVLASGGGSNFQALIDDPRIRANLVGLVCNRPGAGCLQRASSASIPVQVLDHTQFAERSEFDQALAERIRLMDPDWIVMAGFMRILTEPFMREFEGKMLNIHPSLLPKYKGLHTHQRAIEAGDTVAGVTVHWATAELDGGPLIAQRQVEIEPDDTADSLAARVLKQEHELYPAVCHALLDGRLVLKDGTTHLDRAPLNNLQCF